MFRISKHIYFFNSFIWKVGNVKFDKKFWRMEYYTDLITGHLDVLFEKEKDLRVTQTNLSDGLHTTREDLDGLRAENRDLSDSFNTVQQQLRSLKADIEKLQTRNSALH